MSAGIIAMLAEWRGRDEPIDPADQHDDFLDRWLPAAAPLLDAGWNGYGVAPSAGIAMRYCMLMRPDPASREYAGRVAHWVKSEAARRHAAGLHPNPMTNERPGVSGPDTPLPGINP